MCTVHSWFFDCVVICEVLPIITVSIRPCRGSAYIQQSVTVSQPHKVSIQFDSPTPSFVDLFVANLCSMLEL